MMVSNSYSFHHLTLIPRCGRKHLLEFILLVYHYLGVWLYDNRQVEDNAGPGGSYGTTHPLLLEDKKDDGLITIVLFGLNSNS